jgi:DNA adenine methylase
MSDAFRPEELSLDDSVSLLPQPFLRWAGGKRRVLPIIRTKLPREFIKGKTRVFEPFVGGGAFAFSLYDKMSPFFTPGRNLYINDVNPDLVLCYSTIRDCPDDLMKALKSITKTKSKAEFEKIKSSRPDKSVEKAARFIYLNRTCFNGLWRVNSKGDFNVPWGKLKDPKIFDESNILLVHDRLQGASITNLDFSAAMEECNKGDFVYLDPPYLPLSASSSFSKYAKSDFGLVQHFALAGAIRALTKRGVMVMLSNSDTKLTREIYGDILAIERIKVQRSISANAASRVQVGEIIATNYR